MTSFGWNCMFGHSPSAGWWNSGCLKDRWHKGSAVSKQQQGSKRGPSALECLRLALYPTELPPTPNVLHFTYLVTVPTAWAAFPHITSNFTWSSVATTTTATIDDNYHLCGALALSSSSPCAYLHFSAVSTQPSGWWELNQHSRVLYCATDCTVSGRRESDRKSASLTLPPTTAK